MGSHSSQSSGDQGVGLFAKCISLLVQKSTQFGTPGKGTDGILSPGPHLWDYSMEMLQDFPEQGRAGVRPTG